MPPLAAVGYAAVVGVAIDFDHFLVERVNRGRWRAARRGLGDPRKLVLDQDALFEEDSMDELDRLLSHVVIIGAAVPATWLYAPGLGALTAVVLYGHVLADLVWDVSLNPKNRN